MENNKNLVCAHYLSSFLPLSENWIYRILINLRIFTPLILTRSTKNLDHFPFEPIYSLNSNNKLRVFFELVYFKLFKYILFFYRLCKKNKVSILHIHFGNHGIKSIGLKKKLDVPMICSFYGADVFKLGLLKKYQKAYIKLFRDSDKILVLGPYMKEELMRLGCPENKINIHHLGIDTKKIKFKKREFPINRPVKFLLASNFVEKKGIDIVVKALSVIKQTHEITVEIIGDGPLRDSITNQIKASNIANDITLYGYRSYDFFIEKTYDCDVFIQASKTTADNDKEGTPMALVDAMATGMPVVSTRHSDIPEIVIDGYNGFLAEENSVDDLIKCLKHIITYEKFEEMSINARKHVEENFDATIQTNKLDDLYLSLIETYKKK